MKTIVTDFVWVVVSRNYQIKHYKLVLPRSKKDRQIDVFPDLATAYAHARKMMPLYDYIQMAAITPDTFLTKYFK
jgi:hypothetical protein